MLIEAENSSFNPFFKIAMIVGCWSIWNHRNKNHFLWDSKRYIEVCYQLFKEAISMIRHRVRPSLKEGMQDWLDLF
jgi:hypothetical protein